MNLQTFIFTGRSGCGKGTQVALLMDYLQKHDSRSIYHLETGAGFREFIKTPSFSAKLSNEVYLKSDRQPDFLAIWMWSHMLIESLKENQHLMIDGTPRSVTESMALKTAFTFYQRQMPKVIHLEVSRGWSEKHLLSRGRSDDVTAEIKKRLDWYDKDVVPAIDFFRNDPMIEVIEINGEQSIEKVFSDLIDKLFPN